MTDDREDGQLAVPEQLNSDEERVVAAHALRMRGLSWPLIARQVGYATADAAEVMVRRYLQVAAADLSRERRAEALQMSVDRIEALLDTQWTKAEMGDTKAAEFCLRAVATIARLEGVEKLHETEGQSVKTIVITGSSEDYVRELQNQAGEPASVEPFTPEEQS
jgi:hypothetical protein